MAVKIRLSRTGKRGQPSYRIIVCDEQKKRDGKVLENLGFLDPTQNPPVIKINKERVDYWLSVGAQATKTVRELIKK